MLTKNGVKHAISEPSSQRAFKIQRTLRLIKENYVLYLFLLPALAYIIIVCYVPMYGIQIAFRDFRAVTGIWGSKWVGLKHFKTFFSSPRFWLLLKNTLTLSVYSLIAGFPFPIILALMFNYLSNLRFKKIAQTITYAPHFISTVVMVGMLSMFLSPTSGFVNTIIKAITGNTIHFFGLPYMFKHIYVWSGVWQNAGWNAIIYTAALSGVDPQLHEAAIIDGATILKRIRYIDIPTILPTAIILLILNLGSLLSVGFEKAFLMQNDLNINSSEIISTYTYKIGIQRSEYSYSTAIGLFNNIINFVLLVTVNKISKKISNVSLW